MDNDENKELLQQQGPPRPFKGKIAEGLPWVWILGTLLCLAVILFVLFKWWQRKLQKKEASQRVVDPWSELGEKIQSILIPDTLNEDTVTSFYSNLSLYLKELLELRYGVALKEMTSEEIKKKHPSLLQKHPEFEGFFEFSDAVKYAFKNVHGENLQNHKNQIFAYYKGFLKDHV